ncbi:MAG TPA: alpha/beta fold hydrolase, partial [Prevotella sp.]
MKSGMIGACFVGLLQLSLQSHAQEHVSAYDTVDVTYTNTDSIHFGATLTMPHGLKKVPAVVILSGTNPQNRDGLMAGHDIFRQIARFLSSRGIAVLRVDDRGVGGTNGNYSRCTTATFANDALVAVNFLRTVKGIDRHKIGLLGHSEGGAAAAIAASRSKHVAFLVTAAGLMTDGLSAVIQQNKDIVHTSPISEFDMKRYDDINQMMFRLCHKYAQADSATLSKALWDAYNEWKITDDAAFKRHNPNGFDHFRFP